MAIPKVIHQIWSSCNKPLPEAFVELASTWKEFHPDWQYIFWDDQKMAAFMQQYYSDYVESYNRFAYDVQRWDVIRYLILYQMGGLYVDFDTECLANVEALFTTDCCFGTDTKDNIIYAPLVKDAYLNNTYIASASKHPFLKSVIDHVFNSDQMYVKEENKLLQVLRTSGALMLSDVYEQYTFKDQIHVIPAEDLAPFSLLEAHAILAGEEKEEWNERLQKASAVHFFVGSWGYK